jgi:hypothetical protein
VLKCHVFDHFVTLNGTTILTFDLQNAPYLVILTWTGVLKTDLPQPCI